MAKLNELYRLFNDPRLTLGKEQTGMRRMLAAAQARALLVFLERYSREHFAQEESLMKCHACSFRARHAQAHQTLVGMLDSWTVEFHRDIHAGANERMRKVTADFASWFEKHLRTADCKLRSLSGLTRPNNLSTMNCPATLPPS